MRIQSYSDTRARFAESITHVLEDNDELIVTWADHDSVVMLPLAEYESMKETLYLMRSPANVSRLRAAAEAFDHGDAVVRGLIEE